MNFKYKPDDYVPKPGDVIQRNEVDPNNYTTEGNLYVVGSDNHYVDDQGDSVLPTNAYWNTIETKPGSEAKKGDTVICIKWVGYTFVEGQLVEVDNDILSRVKAGAGNWLVLCQEEPTTEPAEPEFTYPIYKKWKRDGSVFKFTSIDESVCIVPDDTRFIGSTEEGFTYHTSASWEDFNPTSPEGYNHQYNYFKSRLDEIDLSFLVHNDIVVKTFGSIPLAQAIVDRAHECDGYDPGDVSDYQNITDEDKCFGSDTVWPEHGPESCYKDLDYTILTWEELLSYEDSIEEPEEAENPCMEIPATYGKPYIIPSFDEVPQQLTKEEPMKNEPEGYIEVGSTWERKFTDECGIKGETLEVSKIRGNCIIFNHGRLELGRARFLQKFKLVSNPSAPVATTETSETTAPKENNMPTTGINYTDARPAPKTLQDLLNEMFGAQLVTDLKNKPATLAMVFDADEDLVEIIALPNDKAAIKLLQNNARKYLDYAISTYDYNDTYSLAFPVLSEKAELKAAKKKSK